MRFEELPGGLSLVLALSISGTMQGAPSFAHFAKDGKERTQLLGGFPPFPHKKAEKTGRRAIVGQKIEKRVCGRLVQPLDGGFSPSSRMAICKSAQASFFWRGSRNRYAGW